MNPEIEAKFLGSIVGSALGDAIGELAFLYREQNALSTVVARLTELRYTDETAMALGLATSLAHSGSLDEEHLGETFRHLFLHLQCKLLRGLPLLCYYARRRSGHAWCYGRSCIRRLSGY